MKFSQILYKQRIGYHFKKHWLVQGRKKIIDTGAEDNLLKRGATIVKAEELLYKPQQYEKIEVVGFLPKKVKLDNTHPNWHDRICHTYCDNNVLLEGLTQAKIITKTVELETGLPQKLNYKQSTKDIDSKVRTLILNSHVFDAEQEKLPKLKDPLRPAWNFPRVYGITNSRINTILILKLLQLIELVSDSNIVKERSLLSDLQFSFPFEKLGNLIQLELRSDVLISSSRPLEPITNESTDGLELPNIHPIKETITLNTENIYNLRNLYPIKKHMLKIHPHTIFVHYNPTEVKNLYEEEVTENQIYGRSLMKTFAVAASYARLMFGDNVEKLPKPVTVQCVQTDGHLFHFGILQLNTLQFDNSDGIKNVWYQTERIPLFEKCCYENGKPLLQGYNSNVISNLLTLYHNI